MHITCPYCGAEFTLADGQESLPDRARCPACLRPIRVPDEEDESSPAESAAPDPSETTAGETLEADKTSPETAAPEATETVVEGEEAVPPERLLVEGLPNDLPPILRRDLAAEILHPAASPWIMAGMGLAALLLIALLGLQFIYYERDRLARFPEFAGTIDLLCRQFGCEVAPPRIPENFRITERSIHSHPKNDAALIVSGAVVNDAAVAQPYPLVELRFADINGRLLAARRFKPEEYLPSHPAGKLLVEPGGQFTLNMEIVDPGTHAVAYEFRFL